MKNANYTLKFYGDYPLCSGDKFIVDGDNTIYVVSHFISSKNITYTTLPSMSEFEGTLLAKIASTDGKIYNLTSCSKYHPEFNSDDDVRYEASIRIARFRQKFRYF